MKIRSAFGQSKLRLFPLLTGLIMIGGLLAGLFLTRQTQLFRSEATNGESTLSLIPKTKALATGDTASFAVTLNTNADKVTVVKLELSYDTTALDQVTFTPGTILPVPLVAPTVSGGKVKTSLGASFGSPYQGTGVVGTLHIRAKSAKSSTIAFTAETKVYAVGKTGSTLASSEGADITVPGSGGTPTGSPVPTRTPTPTPRSGAETLDCNACMQLNKASVIIACVNVCRDINAGKKQCPSACNTVPSAYKSLCLKTLCQ